MRGLTRRWILPVSPESGGDALFDRLLRSRGLRDPAAIAAFCDPRLTNLHDPALLPNVDRAVERIIDALKRGQRIVIYGDYDVDGVTASAILYHTLRLAQPDAKVSCYVPHRLDEGYGLNIEALRQLRREGADLVVSVDCGITAVEPAAEAARIGLDLIITDHHNLPTDGVLPRVAAIVHPRLPGSQYPFGELCGAGVAFKLAWRFAVVWCGSDRVSKSFQQLLLNLLPLAALGTIADVTPLTDENRIIASYGLRIIKQTPFAGLRALIEVSDLMSEKIDCERVGFVLAPQLNACGRMGHAADAVRMLTDASDDDATEIAGRLAHMNRQRQKTEREILDLARRLAEDTGQTRDDHRIIVLAHESWHPGVVGIVCSRLVDSFGRPTILMQKQGDLCKGSGRSIDGYSLHAGLESCRAMLVSFGGHDMAAGLSLNTEQLDRFRAALCLHANGCIGVDQLTPSLRVDCDANLGEFDAATVRRIAALSPFGRSNPKPRIRVCCAEISTPPRQIGANGKHLDVMLKQQGDAALSRLRGVWWNAGKRAVDLAAGMSVDLIVEPKLNSWNGRTSVEVEILDARPCA
jgi:single-stranded-DNA-specific exonuclease